MRTNVTLDESLVSELFALSGEKTKTGAVAAAVREQIRRSKLRALAKMLGRVEVDAKSIHADEEADLRRDRLLAGRRDKRGR